jgi:osmotically-inducible protein OsmY
MSYSPYNERDERYEERWRPTDEGRRGPQSGYAPQGGYATQSGWQRERDFGQQAERYPDWRGQGRGGEWREQREQDEWRNAGREDMRSSRYGPQSEGASRGYGESMRNDSLRNEWDRGEYQGGRRGESQRSAWGRSEGYGRDSNWNRGGERWQGAQREDVSRWESEGGNAPGSSEAYERGPYGNGYGRSFGGDSFGSGAFGSAYGSAPERSGSYGGSYRQGGQGGYGSYGNYTSTGGMYGRDMQSRGSERGNYGNGGQGTWGASSGSGAMQRGSEGESYAGRGPKGFRRSDERIRETVSERLEQAEDVDASEIEVQVRDGEVTLTGTVPSRWMKRCAEDCVEALPGVQDVTNQLRVQSSQGRGQGKSSSEQNERASSSYASSGTSSGSTGAFGNGNESKTSGAKSTRSS